MSTLATNAITDASGGNTATINGYTPTVSNMAGRNRIINGDMRISQRNAGASVTPADGAYTLDRWFVFQFVASKFSVQQNAGSVTPPVGFSNYLGVTSLSAYTVLSGGANTIAQAIEGFNTADLQWGTANAKTVTLSFQVYSSLTGTFGGSIQNSAANRSYPFTYTISSANTWTSISVTIAGDTSGTWVGATNGKGMVVFFGLGVGSTYSGTAGSWAGAQYFSATGATSVVGTSGATFYITGVQLEAGSVATPFEHRQYGQELALCQRYYENNYPTGVAVGSVVGDNASIGLSYRSGVSTPYFAFIFQTRKRSSPTLTAWNGVTGASGTWRGSGSTNEATTLLGNEVSFSALTAQTDSLIRSGFYEASSEL